MMKRIGVFFICFGIIFPSSTTTDNSFTSDGFPIKNDGDASFAINVRKCCLRNEAFIESSGSCAPYDVNFNIPVYITINNTYHNVSAREMNFVEGLLKSCSPSMLYENEFILFDSGQIFSSELNEYFYPNKYCIENLVDDSQEIDRIRLTAAYCPNSDFPQAFDPDKIPVRKCCPVNELVSSSSAECSLRSKVTSDHWMAPIENNDPISLYSANFTSVYEVVPGYPECIMMERGESLDSSWNYKVSENTGYLKIPSLNIDTPNFCIDEHHIEDDQTSPFAYVCLDEEHYEKYSQANPTCANGKDFCIGKCCPLSEMLNQNGHCVEDNQSILTPSSVPVLFSNGSVIENHDADFNFGSPSCGSRGYFVTNEGERGTLMDNGSLKFTSIDQHECGLEVIEYINKNDYCFDLVRHQRSDGDVNLPVPGALICYPESDESFNVATKRINFIYTIFLVMSDIFILISFVIYLTVPDQAKRGLNKNVKLGHSVLGRIILSFLFSLFIAYLCLIVSKNASDAINLASKNACIALGIIMYAAFLTTFFWLNTLCFELWWKCARQERTSGRRWVWYQIYAWGMPLVLGSIVLYIEYSPSFGPCLVKPNFGVHSCFFSETRIFGSTAKWLYLNGPIAILLMADLVFFLLTVKSLMQTVQQSHARTVKRQARQRLKLCFKLFLVMGLSWMTEIISAATSSQKWYIAEIFNCLQGFVIFLIFILKPKILHAVREKIASVCCGRPTSREPLRGKLTFTASVLSDFLSSTKRSHPSVSSHNLSTSSFSTASSQFSWGSSNSRRNTTKATESRSKNSISKH